MPREPVHPGDGHDIIRTLHSSIQVNYNTNRLLRSSYMLIFPPCIGAIREDGEYRIYPTVTNGHTQKVRNYSSAYAACLADQIIERPRNTLRLMKMDIK